MALLAGALVGAAISDSSKWFWWAVVSVLFYLVLLAIKLYSQKLFPVALFGELEAQERLQRLESDLTRQNRIFGYLDSAIEKLNEQTCSISLAPASSICDDSVQIGLDALISPLITRPQYVLACDSDTFTIALRVGHTRHNEQLGLHWSEYFIVFRDDLNLHDLIQIGEHGEDVFSDLNATGLRFDLRNALHSAYNHNKYNFARLERDQNCFAVISAPIPLVCETPEAGGVIMIATDCEFECPADTSRVLQIYGRLIANWLAKYSDCVTSRHSPAEEPASLDPPPQIETMTEE